MTELEIKEILSALGYTFTFNRKKTKFTATKLKQFGSKEVKVKGRYKDLVKFVTNLANEVRDDSLATR